MKKWLALWAEDAHWRMPVRSERAGRDSFSGAGELHYFDEPKDRLVIKVAKLRSGKAWGEDLGAGPGRVAADRADTPPTPQRCTAHFINHWSRLSTFPA